MTDINHRRKNRKPVNQRYAQNAYNNGFAYPDNKQNKADPDQRNANTGSTDYLSKVFHGTGNICQLADRTIGASISPEFSNGHRGQAKAVAGAKKYVRTRTRFHENAATRKLAQNMDE